VKKKDAASGTISGFSYRWVWGAKGLRSLDRKGQRCRVVVRGGRNSALIEFEDGYRAVVSRNGLRKVHGRTGNA
jgi:hypothetical protein